MKFVSHTHEGQPSYGLALEDGSTLDLPHAAQLAGATLPGALIGFIAAGPPATARDLLAHRPTGAVRAGVRMAACSVGGIGQLATRITAGGPA